MKIILASIDKIKPYHSNPRSISDIAVEKVANSIKNFGWRQPIVVDKDYVIIVGHTRLFAARKLKLSVVPVTIADDLNAQETKAYRIADNRTGQETDWLDDFLKTEIMKLNESGFDISLTGFDSDELNKIINLDPINSIDDINEIVDFGESVNFIIKCKDLGEFEKIQAFFKVDAKEISGQTFINKVVKK